MTKLDLTGQRFGKLTAIEAIGVDPNNHSVLWRCKCDCGCETIAAARALKAGKRTGCGCTDRRNPAFKIANPPREAFKDCPYYGSDFLVGCRVLTARVCEKKGRCGFYDQAKREGK